MNTGIFGRDEFYIKETDTEYVITPKKKNICVEVDDNDQITKLFIKKDVSVFKVNFEGECVVTAKDVSEAKKIVSKRGMESFLCRSIRITDVVCNE